MRKARTIVALAGAVLVLTALAAGPAGGAAKRSIAAFAANAGAVNGIKASRTPKAGRLVPLGRNAKLPASVVPTMRGARGLPGPQARGQNASTTTFPRTRPSRRCSPSGV